MKTQVCIRCGKPRALSEFRRGGFGRLKTCKPCLRTSGQGGKCIELRVACARRTSG